MKSNNCQPLLDLAVLLVASACSSEHATTVEPPGGQESAGGSTSNTSPASTSNAAAGAGGTLAHSSSVDSTGGQLASGGFTTASGGYVASGGAMSTGGTPATGGVSSKGGASATGRTSGDGGHSAQGSVTALGASAGTGGKSAGGGTLSVGGAGVGGTTKTNGTTATGGITATGGRSSSGGASTGGTTGTETSVGPCDIFKSAGTPCVAAHSTVRALFGAYNGKLYQVRRTDNTTKDIATLTAGGFADGPAQATFCSGTTCVITVVYDQSGNGNDLWYQGSTVVPGSPQSSPAKADTESLTANGHKVYSLYIKPGNSYWRDGSKSGIPTGNAPEGLYMVTSGKHVNSGCCFDYGNSETTRKADAAGAMDAINFGTQCWFGGCSGTGPWVQADLEWGLFPGGSKTWNTNQKVFNSSYVTAMLKNNGMTEFAIKGANAQSGTLTTLYKGALPSGYSPMKKQGAIVLGSGGDCCKPDGGANQSEGTFYEGAVVTGYPTDATDDTIQSNIVAAGYGAASASFYSYDTQPHAR